MENTTTLRPIPLHASGNQVFVTGHEQKVVIDKLLSVSLFHTQKGEVLASQITFKFLEGALHQILDLQSLFLGDSGRQTETVNAATDTNTGRLNGSIFIDVSVDLGRIHVRGMTEGLIQSMVLQNERVEDISKVLVGISISGVDTAMLIVEFNSASNGLKRDFFVRKSSFMTPCISICALRLASFMFEI